MNALPMLDQVMLWIARSYAGLTIFLFGSAFWTHHAMGVIIAAGQDYGVFSIFLVWLLASFYLRYIAVRIALGLYSAICTILAIFSLSVLLLSPHQAHAGSPMLALSFLPYIIGYGAMTWAAVRPPHHSMSQLAGS
jgi:hypothetical protein